MTHVGNLEVLDHGIGEQLLAHLTRLSFGVGSIGGVDLDDDVATDVDVSNGGEAERMKRTGDRLALRIENATAWSDMYGNAKVAHSVGPVGDGGRVGPGGGLPDFGFPGGRLPPPRRLRRLRRGGR